MKKNRKPTFFRRVLTAALSAAVASLALTSCGAGTASVSLSKTASSKAASSSSASSGPVSSNASWTNTQVPVLMYHSIADVTGNNLCVPPALFASEMQWLSENGYTALSMDELYAHVKNHAALPDKAVVLTFDDGYIDFYLNAYPVLKQYKLSSTVFMITGLIGTSNYLTAAQLKEISQNNVDVEDHTVTHGHLNYMSYDKQFAELNDSKTELEQITGKKVAYVSYPYGDYNADTLRAVQAIGYKMAFREDGGTATVNDPILEVRRTYVSAADDLAAFEKLAEAPVSSSSSS